MRRIKLWLGAGWAGLRSRGLLWLIPAGVVAGLFALAVYLLGGVLRVLALVQGALNFVLMVFQVGIDVLFLPLSLVAGTWETAVYGWLLTGFINAAAARTALRRGGRRSAIVLCLTFAFYSFALAVRIGGQQFPAPYLTTWVIQMALMFTAYKLTEERHLEPKREALSPVRR